MMRKSSLKSAIFFTLIIILQFVSTTKGDARAQMIKITCDQKQENNVTEFNQNFVNNMTDLLGAQMQKSRIATASIGTGPDTKFGLAQCYGDLSIQDCNLCYTEARKVVPQCYPKNGGRIYLDGCFTRFQNYNFFDEYTGPDDTYVCGNETKKSTAFQDTVTRAMSNVVIDEQKNKEYFGKEQMLVSSNGNESVYVLANCWGTLSPSSCKACLENATASVSKCLPWSDGRALNTGCFLRYSDTNFHNPVRDTGRARAITEKVTKMLITVCICAVVSLVIIGLLWFALKRGEERL